MKRSDYWITDGKKLIISQCVNCIYKNINDDTCRAFPEGIPEKILSNDFDHHKPYKGDHDIQFEPIGKNE